MRTKKGFTVVELVIVIAVIAILSAVLIPTFSGLIGKANDLTLQQNLTNAWSDYFSENGQNANALGKGEAFVCADDTITIDSTVYAFNSEGKWVKVTLVAATPADDEYLVAGFTNVCPHEDPDDDTSDLVEYNKYFIFSYAAA